MVHNRKRQVCLALQHPIQSYIMSFSVNISLGEGQILDGDSGRAFIPNTPDLVYSLSIK